MDPDYRYGGEALFLLGIAARLIPWLIRTAREVKEDDGPSITRTTFSFSTATPAASMTVEQHARAMCLIAEHHCPKCGTMIHADVVHGGFGPCRKCGWSSQTSPATDQK